MEDKVINYYHEARLFKGQFISSNETYIIRMSTNIYIYIYIETIINIHHQTIIGTMHYLLTPTNCKNIHLPISHTNYRKFQIPLQ